MFAPSSSTVHRMIRCAASHVLPRVEHVTEQAERGTALHAFLDALVVAPQRRQEALETVPEPWRATAAAVDITEAIRGILEPETEVTFAVNPETGAARVLGHHLERNYAPLLYPGEIAGTCDVMGRLADGTPVLGDWKSGQHVGDVEDFWQTRFLGLALANLSGANRVEVRIWYVLENGGIATDPYTFSRLELDDFQLTLKKSHRTLIVVDEKYHASGQITPISGDHCAYCPSIPFCSAQTGLARAMLPELDLVASAVAELTDANAGRAWRKYQAIKGLLDRVGKSLKLRAKSQTIPLGDGTMIAPVVVQTNAFSEQAARRLLKELGVSDEEVKAKCYKASRYVKCKQVKIKAPKLPDPGGVD